ncbi:hypothetical protein [Phormidium tenue]|uniref:Uncharacterized protein n=1 Tax=Phormidium tenue FACHB-1050 TaxID=2692857 RepID=A0ABR8C7E7_9CYAN|nr:hypothetical protein [Phormidium tenue]MBD2316699.1 hypothetical protein [Phormidium tenue FACHB-1050]
MKIGLVMMMNENFVKIVAMPLAIALTLLLSRVFHTRPELITGLFSQISNAQTIKTPRSQLEERAKACNTPLDISIMTDKQLNDFVFDCEKPKK